MASLKRCDLIKPELVIYQGHKKQAHKSADAHLVVLLLLLLPCITNPDDYQPPLCLVWMICWDLISGPVIQKWIYPNLSLWSMHAHAQKRWSIVQQQDLTPIGWSTPNCLADIWPALVTALLPVNFLHSPQGQLCWTGKQNYSAVTALPASNPALQPSTPRSAPLLQSRFRHINDYNHLPGSTRGVGRKECVDNTKWAQVKEI